MAVSLTYLNLTNSRVADLTGKNVESNVKLSKKLTCKGTSRQVFITLRPLPLLGFCLGWSRNLVGSESGQKQSVKLLQNMVSNTGGAGRDGGGEPERRLGRH